jgi:hypothetical protein
VDCKHDFEAANDESELKKSYLVDIPGIFTKLSYAFKASLKVFNCQKRCMATN